MELHLPTTPWIGSAFRHQRSHSGHDPLDFAFAGSNALNRWNEHGQPTLYLAGDVGVLIAEWGRGFPASFPEDVVTISRVRDVYRYAIRLDSLVDLTDHQTLEKLLPSHMGLTSLLQIDTARSVAAQVRFSTDAQAMLVPSVAFLDDPTRWNLVVFLEKLPPDTALWITDVTKIGPLRWN